MKLFIANILFWLQDRLSNIFKKKEPKPEPSLKIEEELPEKRLEKMNKTRKDEGYLYCHKCGRSTALYRMDLHKRIIIRGGKKKKVYICGSCLQ